MRLQRRRAVLGRRRSRLPLVIRAELRAAGGVFPRSGMRPATDTAPPPPILPLGGLPPAELERTYRSPAGHLRRGCPPLRAPTVKLHGGHGAAAWLIVRLRVHRVDDVRGRAQRHAPAERLPEPDLQARKHPAAEDGTQGLLPHSSQSRWQTAGNGGQLRCIGSDSERRRFQVDGRSYFSWCPRQDSNLRRTV